MSTVSTDKSPLPLGVSVDEQRVSSDLERYQLQALELGASAAQIVAANDVKVDERVRLRCLVPRCLRAGETPNCPPHAPELGLVRAAFARYEWAIATRCDVVPIEDYAPRAGQTAQEKRRVLSFHRQTADLVYELEKLAYSDGYHLVMGFGGGSCKDYLCQGMICQFLDSGRCRFPQRARPAMEAMGIDVVKLINRLGWKIHPLVGDLSRVPCAISVGLVFIV